MPLVGLPNTAKRGIFNEGESMVLFPQRDKIYWYVTDIWETFVPVPIKICPSGKMCEQFGYGRCCEHLSISRRFLYKTRKKTLQVAKKLNREESS